MEDIQHVEVLLRNRVDSAVPPKYGQRWYVHPGIPFDHLAKKSIQKAERRAGIARGQTPPPGRVIAELSFDFWAYLFTKTYASTIWPLVRKTLVATPGSSVEGSGVGIFVPSRADFKREVDVVYKLRNRCAHHEPIVRRDKRDEDARLDRVQQVIDLLALWIDPDAGRWIGANSRVVDLRGSRP